MLLMSMMFLACDSAELEFDTAVGNLATYCAQCAKPVASAGASSGRQAIMAPPLHDLWMPHAALVAVRKGSYIWILWYN